MADDTLTKIEFPRCFKVLPLVYDDSLSYYEAICKMTNKVNELISYLQSFGTDVLAQANTYTDQQVSLTKEELENTYSAFTKQINQDFIDFRSAVQKEIGDYSDKYDTKINELQQAYTELSAVVTQIYNDLNAYRLELDARFDSKYKELLDYINEVVADITRLYVISPIDGKFKDIQLVLNEMFEYLNWGSITAGEYDSLKITAKDYDAKRISAKDYDFSAMFYLYQERFNRMISPFTGQLDYYANVINELANLHKNGLTAEEYDAKLLDADTYDAMGITAYEYDWYGKTVVA